MPFASLSCCMISTLNKKPWKALLSLHLVQSEQCESASQRLCNNNNNASSTMSHQRIHFCSYEKRWQAVPARLVVELSKGAPLGQLKAAIDKRWRRDMGASKCQMTTSLLHKSEPSETCTYVTCLLFHHIPAAMGLHCRETPVYWLHMIWKSFPSMMML